MLPYVTVNLQIGILAAASCLKLDLCRDCMKSIIVLAWCVLTCHGCHVKRFKLQKSGFINRNALSIPKGDEKAVRDILKNVRKRLLYWEYIRQANWYDAGPLADVLTPLQLGTLWGKCIFGNMLKKYSNSSWKRLSPDELEAEIESTVRKTRERLELTTEQTKIIDPLVAKGRRKEYNPERTQRQIDHAKRY